MNVVPQSHGACILLVKYAAVILGDTIVNTSTCIVQMGAIKGSRLTRSVGLSRVDFDFKLILFNLGWFSMSFVFWG